MGISIKKKATDPEKKKGSKRVHKNKADEARQKKNEGSNSAFQVRLRKAEANGEKTFMWEGKKIAARTTGGTKKTGVPLKKKIPTAKPIKAPIKSSSTIEKPKTKIAVKKKPAAKLPKMKKLKTGKFQQKW